MATKKRFLALVLTLVFCFAAIFSVYFTAVEAGHDCVGENCAVCMVIEAIKVVSDSVLLLLVSLILCVVASKKLHSEYICARNSHSTTLISLKTKLSN